MSAALEQEHAVVRLAGTVDFTAVHDLHEQAVELLAHGGDVVVECAEVSHFDTAAFQVLLALDAALREQGRALVLANVGESVERYLALSGLRSELAVSAQAAPRHPTDLVNDE